MSGNPYPKPGPRRRRAPAKPSTTVRRDVIRRDRGRCQWCGRAVDTASGWYSLQHRRARAMGGTVRPEANEPANLVLVHGTGTTGCHGDIEADPTEAARRGFRIRQDQAPDEVEIQRRTVTGLVWSLLDNAGNVTDLRLAA